MKDIFLVLDEETEKAYKAHPEFQDVRFYKVSDGPGQFQGMRIRNAFIDPYCCENENYLACLETIRSSMSLTTKDGKVYLM